jgi:hypothetical protein
MFSFFNKIEVNSIIFLLFILLPSPSFAGGIASIDQVGDANSTILIQGEFENEGIVLQSGDENTAGISQNNPTAGVKNTATINQGSIEFCTGCVATITQNGSQNTGLITQEGERNEANLIQDGTNNSGEVEQLGDDNLATFDQQGDDNTAFSTQTGNDNAFEITQELGDNFLQINQSGGAGSGPGGPFKIIQPGGDSIIINQGP